MKILVSIARFLVGITFLFSGFVKLVDPLGSAYKFQEYFSPEVLNMEFLSPYALPFSIVLIIIEIMLGVMILIGFKSKLTAWGLLGIMLVFLFLTWYSAYYDKVQDCGCFGDALKLSSWNTFYKNIILVALVILLVVRSYDICPILGQTTEKWVTLASLFTFLFITYYVLIHLPIIDFRPFAIGNSIPKGMEYTDQAEYPPIKDFFLESETADLTPQLMKEEKLLLVIAYNLDKSDKEGFANLKPILTKAKENGYKIYGVSSSVKEEFDALNKEHGLDFEVLFCDGTALKTVIRSNPGLITISKGIVMDKRSWIDADDLIIE
ncbi:MAG: DoxX family protein [Flavobacteriaceae bacterium]|nr:MAG: DoxX family protein [Flavobacteriaceae bacterium]